MSTNEKINTALDLAVLAALIVATLSLIAAMCLAITGKPNPQISWHLQGCTWENRIGVTIPISEITEVKIEGCTVEQVGHTLTIKPEK